MIVFANSVEWGFLGKGNANVVLKYVGPDSSLQGKVLRLRLAGQVYDTQTVYDFMETRVRRVLPNIVHVELVKVEFLLTEALNDGYGLLMENIIGDAAPIKKEKYFTVFQTGETTILELKPKWLRKTEYGCRNCAHYVYKNKEKPVFCSLDLLDGKTIRDAVEAIVVNKIRQHALETYFNSPQSVLKTLHSLQTPISLENLTDEEEVTDELRMQMTLRDVTIFMTIKDGIVTEAIVTDVDPKPPQKWESWKKTEQTLITSFYSKSHR